MFMQTVNRTDVERVFVVVNNTSGVTLSVHHPVMKYMNTGNSASVATNEAGPPAKTNGDPAEGMGNLIGLAFEDIPDGQETGLVQVYGYHESVRCAKVETSITAGFAVTANSGNAISVGVACITHTNTFDPKGAGPIIALKSVTNAQASGGNFYADHVFIRAL